MPGMPKAAVAVGEQVRVAFDACVLGEVNTRGRGIGLYVQHLLQALAGLDDLHVSALAAPGTALPAGITEVVGNRWAPERWARLEHALRLPVDVRRTGVEVFHSPGLDPPWRLDLPWVQTVHDVIPLVFRKQWRPEELKMWGRIGPRIVKSTLVIADSTSTADDVVRLLGLDAARVRVSHLGVDPAFKPPAERVPVDPPYLLTVGQWDIHKGYEEAFELISRVAESGWPHRLKVVGNNPPWAKAIVDSLLSRSAHPERVDLLGRVDLASLVELYQNAVAVIVSSRYEGFGFPALESMACATPVVAFRNSSLPEVIRDGGVLVDDGDVAAMATEVDRLLGDPQRWRELSQRGATRSRRFDWATVAKRHREIYGEAVELWHREKAGRRDRGDRR